MKRSIKMTVLVFVASIVLFPTRQAVAQIPVADVIAGAIKRVIKAVDLQIQRQQNKVIWLQNAQKTLENTMSKLKLDEITGWVEKQKTLYQDYYDELWKVKAIIAYYQRIRDIVDKQVRLVREYQRAWGLLRQDDHFNPGEIDYMGKVYSGILSETGKNIDQMMMIVNSFQTQMSDAKRMELINQAADQIDQNYSDLKEFNRQNMLLSLQRAKSANDAAAIRQLYNIQ
ncbi:conjugal transfer protein TraI [Mucilaginibacter defluvii]|uniref:Conjugal transfer protein TraI n=1 Tax=Mucilaginibacter defluvii TaxID=1196019 RepID=A0ABP9FLG3_9SPHI